MNPPSKTPETDALSETMCRTAKMEKWRNLSRKLEIERDEARAALERINTIAVESEYWFIAAISRDALPETKSPT